MPMRMQPDALVVVANREHEPKIARNPFQPRIAFYGPPTLYLHAYSTDGHPGPLLARTPRSSTPRPPAWLAGRRLPRAPPRRA